MKLTDKSAGALTWLAILFFVPGLMIPSPGGRFFFAALAGLIALVPLAFAGTRRRLVAGVVVAVCLLTALATYPEFSQEQASYRDRARPKTVPPAGN